MAELMEPSAGDLVDAVDHTGLYIRLNEIIKPIRWRMASASRTARASAPNRSTLYCGPRWVERIYAFDYDAVTGRATNRRTVCDLDGDTVPGANTVPDGATSRWATSGWHSSPGVESGATPPTERCIAGSPCLSPAPRAWRSAGPTCRRTLCHVYGRSRLFRPAVPAGPLATGPPWRARPGGPRRKRDQLRRLIE